MKPLISFSLLLVALGQLLAATATTEASPKAQGTFLPTRSGVPFPNAAPP